MQDVFDKLVEEFEWVEYEYELMRLACAGLSTIDIAAELMRLACTGLSAIDAATSLAEGLRMELANVGLTFTCFKTTPADHHKISRGDDLELRAASALREVDEILRQQAAREAPPLPRAAVEELKMVQRHAQDLAVLACSRFIDQMILQKKGIPAVLYARLQSAFTAAALADDALWSRLGSSKYHVFTQGLSFGERRKHHGRAGRRGRDLTASSSAASSAATSWAALPEPLRVYLNRPMYLGTDFDGSVVAADTAEVYLDRPLGLPPPTAVRPS
jgi:hypothetical protein